MGVGSLVAMGMAWTSFIVVFLVFAVPVTLIVKSLCDLWRLKNQPEFILERTSIEQPDDLGHAYALIRAWDRHLLSLGLPPVGGEASRMLESVKVSDPNADVWWIDEYGTARTVPCYKLPKTYLRKASDSPSDRVTQSLPGPSTL